MRVLLALAMVLAFNGHANANASTKRKSRAPSHALLGDLNPLVRSLAPAQEIAPGELDRLVQTAEVVGFRDGARGPTPMAITYAALLERNLGAMTGVRPVRALVQLAIALAPFGGPEAAAYEDAFLPLLAASAGVKPTDMVKRPELAGELAQIGAWAEATVKRLAPRLPATEAAEDRAEMALARGHYREAVIAWRGHKSSLERAWLAAAFVLEGHRKQAAPLIAAARAQGGQAETIVERAEARRALADKIPAGVTAAAREIRQLFAVGAAHLGPSARAASFHRYFDALEQLTSPPVERAELALLGYIGAAPSPLDWASTSPDEKALLVELDHDAPCARASFALRALALRATPAELAAFARQTLVVCGKKGATGVAVDAGTLLLALSHQLPAVTRASDLEPLLRALETKQRDALVLGAHADAIALDALGRDGVRRRIGLEAALERYEEAIAETTPMGGVALRARLEANAGYLALTLARATSVRDSTRAPLLERAARHLRFAVALDENGPVIASRALFDLETGRGKPAMTASALERLPAGRNRARAACVLAAQATSAKDASAARLLALARQGNAHEPPLSPPELMLERFANFEALPSAAGLRPLVRIENRIFLSPDCSPEHLPTRTGR